MTHYDKMSAIFMAFDKDKTGLLEKSELINLIQRCNRSVELTSLQLDAIVSQVLLEYEHNTDAPGLSKQGLVQLYLDGTANSSEDFDKLNLTLDGKQQLGEYSRTSHANEADCSIPSTADPFSPAASRISDAADDFSDLFDLTPLPIHTGMSSGVCTPIGFHTFESDDTEPSLAAVSTISGNFCTADSPVLPEQSALTQLCPSSSQHQQMPASQVRCDTRTPRARGGWRAPQRAERSHSLAVQAPTVASSNELQAACIQDAAQSQDSLSGGALVDTLADALQSGAEWQQTAQMLRQKADSLDSADRYDAHMEMGMLLASRKQHDEAVKSFKQASLALPGDARPLFRLGNACFAAGQLSEAQQAFSEALAAPKQPDDAVLLPKVHVNLGIALEASGEMSHACQHYREAVRMDVKHSRAFKLLGSALYAQGDLHAAKDALQSSLALNPSYADAYCDLGCVLCALAEVQDAKMAFQTAARFNPQHLKLLLQEPHHELQALGNLGNVHKQCSEFAEAVKCYDAVLQLNPHDWRSLLSKAVALMGLKQQHAAQTALQQAYQHSGGDAALLAEMSCLGKIAPPGISQQDVTSLLSCISMH